MMNTEGGGEKDEGESKRVRRYVRERERVCVMKLNGRRRVCRRIRRR